MSGIEGDRPFEEDYYAHLNIPRNASHDEIHNAYRKFSKLYHPDKHTDPALKKDAEVLFNHTKKAYEVLKDPHKRAIYDSLGVEGLRTDGWKVAIRTKGPKELREEYEKLAKEKEEEKMMVKANPKSSMSININAMDLFNSYSSDEDEKDDLGNVFSSIEVSGMSFTQSIDIPLTQKTGSSIVGNMSVKNGVGSGSILFTLKRLLSSKSWFEVEVGAGNGPLIDLRFYRSLTKLISLNCGTAFHFTPNGLNNVFAGTLTMPLDLHTVGHLTYSTGKHNAMNTTIVRSMPDSYTAFSIQVAKIGSFVSLNYTHKLLEKNMSLRGYVNLGMQGWVIEYGAEKSFSITTSASATVHVGSISGVSLRLRFKHAYQIYNFPILLSDEVFPSVVFYATATPIIGWVLLKNFIISPIMRERTQREKEKMRELNIRTRQEKQREAKSAINLMKATFSRIRSEEESKGGLIITKALYGRFVYPQNNGGERTVGGQHDEIIDVTIPLQCFVKDSKLVLHNASKSQLPGFYDPCVGEDKQLLIQYLFHMQIHECLIKDNEPLRIPRSSHCVNTT